MEVIGIVDEVFPKALIVNGNRYDVDDFVLKYMPHKGDKVKATVVNEKIVFIKNQGEPKYSKQEYLNGQHLQMDSVVGDKNEKPLNLKTYVNDRDASTVSRILRCVAMESASRVLSFECANQSDYSVIQKELFSMAHVVYGELKKEWD